MKTATRRQFMGCAGKSALFGLGLGPVLSLILGGCKTIEQAADIGAQLGVGSGLLNYAGGPMSAGSNTM